MDYRTIQNAMIKRAEEHTVAKGQTLSGIGKQYGIPWKQIAADNKISNPNNIRVGQKLQINQPVQQPQTQATHSSVIQKNDPIMFNGKPVKIYDKVPFTRRDAFTYTVQKGDNATSIAHRYGMLLPSLKTANPKIPDINKLSIGQKINIPVTDRQAIMEKYGYDPETPVSDEKIKDAAVRIAKAESGWGSDLRAKGSTGSGWHHILDALFTDQMNAHKDLYVDKNGKPWTKAMLDDKDSSFLMAEQAIRDYIHDYQYGNNGLMPDDMKPVYRWWRVGSNDTTNKDANDYADDMIRLY